MTRPLLSLALLALLSLASPSHAEEQDVSAAVRSVVRVVLVARKGQDSYFVGHGSGLVVAPDKVLTNAHVVELLHEEPSLVLGIVPSEGTHSYGGRVVAFSPGNDLALIQLAEGRLPVSTFFAGAVGDGQHVTAIGYPGAVDRAQGLNVNQMVQPLIPVKTSGNISAGRSSQSFDTLLHTAPMATGNSGGPLVDDCGRVLGINSFRAVTDGDDANFGFAISNREIASFLRQAGVNFQRSAVACRSIADLDAQEAARAQQDQSARAERAQTDADARQRQLDHARSDAEQQVISARENAMALAAVLLALGVLTAGASALKATQGRRRPAIGSGIAAVLLLIASGAAFALRPSFEGIEEKVAQALPQAAETGTDTATYDATGDNWCRLDDTRSRITVSDTAGVPLHWQAGGCVNGSTQYGPDQTGWSRVLVPNNEATVSINRFDPDTGTYRVERYLADAATLDRARELRGHVTVKGCTQDRDALGALSQMQADIRAILPAHPNERLVYNCAHGAAPVEKPEP